MKEGEGTHAVKETKCTKGTTREQNNVFEAPWHEVCLASLMKYPSPLRTDIACVDIIRKELDLEKGIIKLRRLMVMETCLPLWMPKCFAKQMMCEDSIINIKEKTFTQRTANLTFNSVARISEKIIYYPSPNNLDHTQLYQRGRVQMSCHFWGSCQIETFLCDHAESASIVGRNIISNKIAENGLRDWQALSNQYMSWKMSNLIPIASQKE
jgi:hypothetical protein